MLQNLRNRASDEGGFTLIELLVVILIIGILAAIAIPSFLSQRQKAQDAEAKTDARTAQTAQETYFTNENKYTAVTADLKKVEKTLNTTGLTATATGTGTTASFSVEATSKSGNKFKVTRAVDGTVTRNCTTTGEGACPSTGSW